MVESGSPSSGDHAASEASAAEQASVSRTHAFDDRPLGPAPGLVYPISAAEAAEAAEASGEPGEHDGLFAWIQYLAVRAIQRSLLLMPAPVRKRLIGGLARFLRLVDRRHALPAMEFVACARPHLDERAIRAQVLDAYRHLINMAVQSEALPQLAGGRLGDHFQVELCPEAEELLASNRSVLLVSAHVGVWEATPWVASAVGAAPLYAVGKPPRNLPLGKHFQRLREAQGVVMLPRRGAMQAVKKVLAGGGSLALLLDQRANKRPVIAPFFGRPAACDRSAAVLVRRMKAPVVFYGCYAQEGLLRFRVRFPKVLWPEELAGLGDVEVCTLINRHLEGLILEQPDQYFWLHDRYKKKKRLVPVSSAPSNSGPVGSAESQTEAPEEMSPFDASSPD